VPALAAAAAPPCSAPPAFALCVCPVFFSPPVRPKQPLKFFTCYLGMLDRFFEACAACYLGMLDRRSLSLSSLSKFETRTNRRTTTAASLRARKRHKTAPPSRACSAHDQCPPLLPVFFTRQRPFSQCLSASFQPTWSQRPSPSKKAQCFPSFAKSAPLEAKPTETHALQRAGDAYPSSGPPAGCARGGVRRAKGTRSP
jgi:hypothetical protein